MMYLSPRFSARQVMPPASDPALGSDRLKAANLGSSAIMPSHFFFCSGLPAMSTGVIARPLAMMDV